MKRNCENCTWFAKFDNRYEDIVEGTCRINPPVAVPTQKISGFPFVHGDLWCGRFLEREKSDE